MYATLSLQLFSCIISGVPTVHTSDSEDRNDHDLEHNVNDYKLGSELSVLPPFNEKSKSSSDLCKWLL